MAAKKKVTEKDVVKKKVAKPKAGAETAKKEKPVKAAATKTGTARAAKAKPAEKETKTGKLGGLIKRVTKILPRKKVAKETPTTRPAAARANHKSAKIAETAVDAPKPVAMKSAPKPVAAESDSRLVLMMRDPQTLHAFWAISQADREKYGLDKPGGAPPLLLRMYDREGGTEASETYRCQIVVASTERWTVQVPPSGRTWRAEIGFIGKDGHFQPIAQSNLVVMQGPPMMMSVQEGTATVPFGEGAEALRGWAEKFELPVMSPLPMPMMRQAGSIMVPVPGVMELRQPGSLMSQPGSLMGQAGSVGVPEKKKGYWLQVATELILYGATEPGSKLTVQDVPVELAPDGTFSLRFALPEGFHVLPVHAVSPEGDDERTITPIVLRLTE
ncbi:DUF4912 domain-containing protein [bacterium]|nr:DUF4912 domain-containing protein [bacterium]